MKDNLLFESINIGEQELKNRVVMAPLTRCRAEEGFVPSRYASEYYTQRASVGLIISEATQISQQGQGYINTPGIYTPEQVNGWWKVTDAVHKNNGKIFLQLWHVGRQSHSDFQRNNMLPVAPSAVGYEGYINTPYGRKKIETPRELTLSDIKYIIDDYVHASKMALKAGFDGVEIHGANGYLIDQFLQDSTNKRLDHYGGSFENRSRFLFDVIEAVCSVWPKEKVGLRLSPGSLRCGISDSKALKIFDYVIYELNKYNLAYLHIVEPTYNEAQFYDLSYRSVVPYYRRVYRGKIIGAAGYDYIRATEAVNNQKIDMIAFGRLMISNPDLVERFKMGYSLSSYDESTFYTQGSKGYIDYPFM
ncbi:MAG: alkene reductase [Hyphomicrobiales bacterium]